MFQCDSNVASRFDPARNLETRERGEFGEQELLYSVLQYPAATKNGANHLMEVDRCFEKIIVSPKSNTVVPKQEERFCPVAPAEGTSQAQMRANELGPEALSFIASDGEQQEIAGSLKRVCAGEQQPIGVLAGQQDRQPQPGSRTTSEHTAPAAPMLVLTMEDECMTSAKSFELDENSARQLLNNSGWKVSQSLRRNGCRQWYYRSPPRPKTLLLGSLASAVALWKKAVDEQHKEKGGGDNDLHPLVTSFLNKLRMKRSSTKRKKRPAIEN